MEAMHFAGIINMQQQFDIHICHLHQVRTMRACNVSPTLSQALNVLSQTASSLHLIMLNVDKLIYFRQPLHYERLVTPTRLCNYSFVIFI